MIGNTILEMKGIEQDRLRAILPKDFESLRPVLRINTEIRQVNDTEIIYIEFNTPVAYFEKRGWLNIAYWESLETDITYTKNGESISILSPFLEITYTKVDVAGGCPAENYECLVKKDLLFRFIFDFK